MKIIPYLLIIFFLTHASCQENRDRQEKKINISAEQLAEVNRQLMIKDRERIVSYIERKGLQMTETETGLWITTDTESKCAISEGDKVTLEYVCSLLDGTVIYDSDNEGLMSFEVGRSDVPSGLTEGVKLLDKGSEATLIIPGYLGYGLMGDEKKIPARSILVYQIKVVSVD